MRNKNPNHIRMPFEDKLYLVFCWIIIVFCCAIVIYPVVYTFSMAISDPVAASRGEVVFLPKGFDLTAIKTIINDPRVPRYYLNTIFYTITGTLVSLISTTTFAYALSRKDFILRGPLMKFLVITMFVGGGMIPSFIINTRVLHLYNNPLVLIVPGCVSCWYVTMARNYMESLPIEVMDSARIDGAREMQIFRRITLPLCKPMIGVLTLYRVVAFWNAYFTALVYIKDSKWKPISLYVMNKVVKGETADLGAEMASAIDSSSNAMEYLAAMQLKYAVILVTVLPMLIFYPFFSKYFEKGILIGSMKG